MHCASVLRITQGNWQHLKMATFREGKLARKRNGRFQSKAGKSRTEKFLDSQKRKSSDGLADTIKLSLQSECESETVLSGRRIVELGLLSKELADGCKYCKSPLQLSNCWKETVSGHGSFLYITCREDNCGEINVCHTSKVHRVSDRGRPVFDVNTKLAAGKYNLLYTEKLNLLLLAKS